MTRPIAFASLALLIGFAAPVALAAPPSIATFSLTGEDGKTQTMALSDLASLPHTGAALTHEGKSYGFKGVLLADVLARVGAPLGKAMRGPALSDVVIVKAKDGYTVVLALSDLEPSIRATKVLLADADAAGAPLGDKDGPFRLVVEGDLEPARSERNVISIEVRRLGVAP